MAQRVTIVSDVQNIMKEEWHWIEKKRRLVQSAENQIIEIIAEATGGKYGSACLCN